jgi:hypothetical protein
VEEGAEMSRREGSLKAVQTTKERWGEEFYAEIGKIGGMVRVPKGFAVTGRASAAGKLGNTIKKEKRNGIR